MKILLINNFLGIIGGVERYLSEIAVHLEKRGHRVFTITSGARDGIAVRKGRDIIIPGLSDFDTSLDAETRKELVRHLEDISPDVTYYHNLQNVEVMETVTRYGRPFIFAHTLDVTCPGGRRFLRTRSGFCRKGPGLRCLIYPYIYRCNTIRPRRLLKSIKRVKLLKRVFKKQWEKPGDTGFKKITVASSFMKKELVNWGIDENKIVWNPLIPTVEIHCSRGSQHKQEISPMRNTRPIILFVGRLAAVKGVDVFLESAKMLENPADIVIVGDGGQQKELEQIAKNMPSGINVNFVGRKEGAELIDCYQKARVVVFPSVWAEPFGLAGLDALILGRPVVAFDTGGVSDWLSDGESGFLVKHLDKKGMAEKIDLLTGDKELAEEMGRRGREEAVSRFSVQNHIKTLCDLFEE
jgi:glycosyltransferase involved in cell wall biosynthesis